MNVILTDTSLDAALESTIRSGTLGKRELLRLFSPQILQHVCTNNDARGDHSAVRKRVGMNDTLLINFSLI